MSALKRELRRELERTVRIARRAAESGARNALEELAVHNDQPWDSQTAAQRALRNRLRAHGRQLGDMRDEKRGTQTIQHLVHECAYEQWHRMLFSRFLAETGLLIEPVSGVAISLPEIQELARERNCDWIDLASEYAEKMLPQIFRNDDPVLDVVLPPEARSELEDLLRSLPAELFRADDSLGWVYQFWQGDKKDEINSSGSKVGADQLSAVTQLFTEDYMVRYLLHNTLGAWWAAKVLDARPELAVSARDEEELRAECRVGDIDWTYLRFVRDGTEEQSRWRPAAGSFEGWPRDAKSLRVLDPCMGSGHFLVSALPILAALRVAEEDLDLSNAVLAVLTDNLYGLEIDPRCTQIAAFNVAFVAWRTIGYVSLPKLNLACSGVEIGVTKTEWLQLGERIAQQASVYSKRDLFGVENDLLSTGIATRVRNGLERLFDMFTKAPWLGSLIDPSRLGGDIFHASFEDLEPLLSLALGAQEDEAIEVAVAAQGLARAADILAQRFTLVVTNVPYLVKGKQDQTLRDFCAAYAPDGSADLATVFLERCGELCQSGGTHATVSPQNWLFLKSYSKFRCRLLREQLLSHVTTVGAGNTATASWDVLRALVISSKTTCKDYTITGTDTDASSEETRAAGIGTNSIVSARASDLVRSRNCRIAIAAASSHMPHLSSVAVSLQGTSTGDNARYQRYFWECADIGDTWELLQGAVSSSTLFGGREKIMRWEGGEGGVATHSGAAIRGLQALNKRGVAVTQMRSLPATLYTGTFFDTNVAVLLPRDDDDVLAIWSYCSSDEFVTAVRKLDKKLSVTNATFEEAEFDAERWRKVASDRFPAGFPHPQCGDATQWLFDGDPRHTSSPLHVAVARLLGYEWPRRSAHKAFDKYPPLKEDRCHPHISRDGIVCLPSVFGQPSAEDQLLILLADVFSTEWSSERLAALLSDVGFANKSLGEWLRDGFFEQHCDTFYQRPFIWHVWDGRRDGFHAFVNYQRLAAPDGEGRRLLEKLIYSYLGAWIERQRAEQKIGVNGADARIAAAERLRSELTKILEGEPPYDIFVRWKPLLQQPVGWEPDLNDGVRVNIRPFIQARLLDGRGTSCILRVTPKMKWDKDRGIEAHREREDFPWFWNWDGTTSDFMGLSRFDGVRWNDLHYSRAVKLAARQRRSVPLESRL